MNEIDIRKLQIKFEDWLKLNYKQIDGSNYAKNTIDMIKSDAIFLENDGKYFDIDLKWVISESKNPDFCVKILEEYRDKLEKHFIKDNEIRIIKGKSKRSKSPSTHANEYVKWLSFLLDCYNDKQIGWFLNYYNTKMIKSEENKNILLEKQYPKVTRSISDKVIVFDKDIDRKGFKSYLKDRFQDRKDSYINTIYHDAFYLKNNPEVGIDFQEIILTKNIPVDLYSKLMIHLKSKGRKYPESDARGYERYLIYLLEYLEGHIPISSDKPKSIKIKKQSLSEQLMQTTQDTLDDLVDNVIKVKIGLRVLAKDLIPYVINEYKQKYNNVLWKNIYNDLPIEQRNGYIEGKLDLANCLSLLDKCWDDLFKPKIAKRNPKKFRSVRSYINELKDDRNINAHDGLEDVTYDVAYRTLDTVKLLCEALDADVSSNKITRIISTLKKY